VPGAISVRIEHQGPEADHVPFMLWFRMLGIVPPLPHMALWHSA